MSQNRVLADNQVITIGFVLFHDICLTCRTFRERCRNEYANNTDFYATVYDKTEVIDAVCLQPVRN